MFPFKSWEHITECTKTPLPNISSTEFDGDSIESQSETERTKSWQNDAANKQNENRTIGAPQATNKHKQWTLT